MLQCRGAFTTLATAVESQQVFHNWHVWRHTLEEFATMSANLLHLLFTGINGVIYCTAYVCKHATHSRLAASAKLWPLAGLITLSTKVNDALLGVVTLQHYAVTYYKVNFYT